MSIRNKTHKILTSIEYRDFSRLTILTVLITVLMVVLTDGKFLSIRSINSMLVIMPELGILCIGIMLAMIVGGIDLSLVAIANLSGVLSAKLMFAMGDTALSTVLGIAVALGVGMICGGANGFLIARIGVPPILITLGTFQLYQGIAIVISKGYAIVNFSKALTDFSNGSVLNVIPYIFILFLIIVWCISFMLNNTKFGQSLYLVGDNYKASVFSALKSKTLVHNTYILVGLLGSIAGIIMVTKTNSAKADYGASYTLQSILVCLLGGVNWSGGVGKPSGVLLALFALQFLNSGFSLMRFSNFFLVFIAGTFLLFVLLMHYYLNRYDEKRKILNELNL